MKTTTKEIYQCDHCKKWYHRKHACIKHEDICKSSPDNWRDCFNCKNLTKKQTMIMDEENNKGYQIELLFCKANNHFLYTPLSEKKGRWYVLAENTNNPMPKECNLYQDNLYQS